MPACTVMGFDCVIFWNATGAIATAIASIVALISSYIALTGPERERKREQKSATKEVVHAVLETMELYAQAVDDLAAKTWGDDRVRYLRVRGEHLSVTIDRLLNKPTLSDGAIAIGAGAVSILSILRTDLPLQAELPTISPFPGGAVMQRSPIIPALAALQDARPAIDVIVDRLKRIQQHHGLAVYSGSLAKADDKATAATE